MGKGIRSGAHDCEQKNSGRHQGKNGADDPSLGPCKGTVGGAARGSSSRGKSNSNALKIPFFTSIKSKWAEPMANLEKCSGQGITVSFESASIRW